MVSLDLKSSGTASADVMLGRSVDNLFDANDPALPQTGYQTASLDSLLTGLSTLSCSPLVPVRDAVSLLTRPHNYVDKAKIDARRVPAVSLDALVAYYWIYVCSSVRERELKQHKLSKLTEITTSVLITCRCLKIRTAMISMT